MLWFCNCRSQQKGVPIKLTLRHKTWSQGAVRVFQDLRTFFKAMCVDEDKDKVPE
jgi:hypothetical protein